MIDIIMKLHIEMYVNLLKWVQKHSAIKGPKTLPLVHKYILIMFIISIISTVKLY